MIQDIELTPGQEIGKYKIEAFLKSNHRIFRLQGAAGTGKTTLIKYCLQEYLAMDYENRGSGGLPHVLGIALAHKAKNVLKGSILNVATFALAYGYKEKFHDNGDRTFEPADYYEEPPLGHEKIPVFVMDEVSMFNQKMVQIMLKETPKTSKIILMGDRAQLPPPGGEGMEPDQDSPVFYMDLPEECQHELLDPVRQKAGNPILDLAYIIREEIMSGSYDLSKCIQAILQAPMINGIGCQVSARNTAIMEYVYGGDYVNNKIIVYQNKTVMGLNTYIRNIVQGNPTETLVDNDIIFLTNNFKSEKPKFKLNNADEFIIKRVSKGIFDCQGYKLECYFAFVPHEDYNFPVFILWPTDKGITTYKGAMEYLSGVKAWKKFWRFKDSFTEFTMGYVINAYRSQGSTYKNVYIDLSDILQLNEWGVLSDKRTLQTMYTVITRASHTVTFFTK